MTREEAIMHLDYLKDYKTPQQIEAINLAIKALSVTTEQSSMAGEWIKEFNGNGWNDYWDYTCPVCGKKYERGDNVLYDSSFCPNCGSRMRGIEE